MRLIFLAVLLLWVFLGALSLARAAGSPSNGSTLFNNNTTYCTQCHISPPEGNRLLAANNRAVIQNAIANDYGGTYTPGGTTGMGQFSAGGASPLSNTQLDDIAAYIGLFVVPTTANKSVSVNYASSNNTIDLSGDITVGTPASISIPTGPSNGTIDSSTVQTVGGTVLTRVVYTPNATYYGADSFTYNVTNSAGTSTTRTVSITVNNPPAPVTSNASPNVSYGSSNNVLNLDAFISGVSSGNVQIVASPTNGTINSTLNETVTYTPNPTYSGNDAFTYRINGPGGMSNTSTVTVSVGLPPAPVANNASTSVTYNSTNNAFDLTPHITNPSTSVSITVNPTNGTINSTVGNVVTYTPNNGYYGADSYSYTATGPGGGPSAAAVVSITVGNPPAPGAGALSLTVPFNTAGNLDLSTGATGVYTSTALVTTPSNGTANLAGNIVTYTPTAGYSGADSFTYRAIGPGGNSAPATVTVTVSTLAPTAGATTMTVPLNTATTLNLAPFITGSSITGVSISTNPSHGTVSTSGTSVTYTPTTNYFGTDTFSYQAYGNAGTSAPATVTVTVTGRPNPAEDPRVGGLISSQVDSARRFARAQVSNIQTRLESLHRSGSETALAEGDPVEAPAAGFAASGAGGGFRPALAGGLGQTGAPSAPAKPTGAAYRPAASLSGDPSAGLGITPAHGSAVPTIAAAISSSTAGLSENDPAREFGKAFSLAASVLQSGSLNLNSSTGTGDRSSAGGIEFWTGGGVRFGRRSPSPGGGAISFTTDGISFGADRRFNDQLVLGVGFGYARDKTDIGTDGTNSRSRGGSIAAYGSYQPTADIYVDAMLGYGTLRYQTDRFIPAVSDFARSARSGDYVFGSVTAGYEHKQPGLLLSPYGRLDVAQYRLDAATESGGGASALTYAKQSFSSASFAAGLRAESAHEASFGYVTPRLRLEVQHDFKGENPASVSYADQPGVNYTVAAAPSNRNSLVLGVGSDFILRRGLTFSIDYQAQRASSQDNSHAIFVKMVKDLDGRGIRVPVLSGESPALLAGLKVEASYTFDDNVTRAGSDLDKGRDNIYGLNFGKRMTRQLSDHTRLAVNGFAGVDKFRVYNGLTRLYAGVETEFQYRSDGDFGTPTLGLFGNLTGENYETDLRDGFRWSVGLSVLKPVTDRITMFGALARNGRNADSAVFSTRDYSARLNIDYALAEGRTLYLTGEYRHGDIVSTGAHTLANINVSKVFVRDDAFAGLYAYQVEGRTGMLTLGYNVPFGPKDSLDISWRRVHSYAFSSPGLPGISAPSYIANQFSVVYLTSF